MTITLETSQGIVVLPNKTKPERISILREALSVELKSHMIDVVNKILRDFFNHYKQNLEQLNIPIPISVEFDFVSESCDTSSVISCIEEIYFKDTNGDYIDNMHDVIVFDENSEYDGYLYDNLIEILYHEIGSEGLDINELDEYLNDYTFAFGGDSNDNNKQ